MRVQEQLANAHGSQCGFCTPGFVMSMYALLRAAKGPVSSHDIETALAGNLCRCTGYRPILDAFAPFTEIDHSVYTDAAIQARAAAAVPQNGAENGAANGHTNGAANGHTNGVNGSANGRAGSNGKSAGNGKICPSTGKPCGCGDTNGKAVTAAKGDLEALKKGPVCEPIFPPKLAKAEHVELSVEGAPARTDCACSCSLRPVQLYGPMNQRHLHDFSLSSGWSRYTVK